MCFQLTLKTSFLITANCLSQFFVLFAFKIVEEVRVINSLCVAVCYNATNRVYFILQSLMILT